MPLFEKVFYYISQSLGETTRRELSRILDSNGATEDHIHRATHILSDTIELEDCENLPEGVACVTPYWVERSMELGQLQDTKYFSADKEMFFSGVVATSADLPSGDKEVIASGILAQGGAWREGLTRDVTHLFVTNTRSEKYQTAMHFRESAHITILLPQWFDQCWSTQMRLPPEVFQFPDPLYLRKDHDSDSYKVQMMINSHSDNKRLNHGIDKLALFSTLHITGKSSPSVPRPRDVWQGRSILLSSALELDAQRRESVEARIRRTGGIIVIPDEENDETSAIERTDVFITRFRAGPAYAKALADGKTIGTLAWLFYVERSGIVSRPRDQLLHYPFRSKPIRGFSDHEITVTNYQGDAREYLKKLIEIMGAKFTPTMSGNNTIVIAAHKGGNKTAKAEEWSIPVVNHKWLEDCFVEWRNLTPAQKRYLDYAPGVNYGALIGDRGVARIGLEEDPELSSDIAPKTVSQKEQRTTITNGEGPSGTAPSIREALEVDEVDDALHVRREDTNDVPRDQLSSKARPDNETEAVKENVPVKIGPPTKPKPKSKSKQKLVTKVVSEPGSDDDSAMMTVLEARSPGKSPQDKSQIDSHSGTIKVTKPVQELTFSMTDKDKGKDKSKSKGKGGAKHIPQPSPNRIVSVELPSPRLLLMPRPSFLTSSHRPSSPEFTASTSKRLALPGKQPARPLARTASIRTSAQEGPVSSPQRGRPSSRHDTPSRSSTSSPHQSSRRLADARPIVKSKARASKAFSVSSGTSTPPPQNQRIPSRRSAAAAATQKLHDEVMPDVVSYENEKKRGSKNGYGRRRKSSHGNAREDEEEENDDEEESDVQARATKKRKVVTEAQPSTKGKGPASRRASTKESDMPTNKFVTHNKNAKRPNDAYDLEDTNHSAQGGSRKKVRISSPDFDATLNETDGTPRQSSWDPRKIRILKTKLEVPSHVEEGLFKLGLRYTQKPHECTHLVTGSLTRTEKLLCALANAPFVLNMDWLIACVKSQRVVAEDDYMLRDPDMERKFKFKLVDALARARELKKKKEKVLQGHFFFYTPSIQVQPDMLKNVLKAHGAECKQVVPTMRNLSETRHIISCLNDEHLWRPLARLGATIYSFELVLSAACSLCVDWDNEDMILARGSTSV
ncbi:hypothetical protein K439DRAFT_819153 [Ramaria rubella]|nr:hypothetical protein K439DRAFT_819153 [Ramaria rubella]